MEFAIKTDKLLGWANTLALYQSDTFDVGSINEENNRILLGSLVNENNVVPVLVHEELHHFLWKFEGYEACTALDNIAGTITTSKAVLMQEE